MHGTYVGCGCRTRRRFRLISYEDTDATTSGPPLVRRTNGISVRAVQGGVLSFVFLSLFFACLCCVEDGVTIPTDKI